MILERHYDEEALIAMLNSPNEVISRDAHLSGCATCTQHLESYQVMSEVLGEKHVWDFADTFDEGAEKGAAAIRAFAEKMEREDIDAVALVDELVKLPRQWWVATAERDVRYHNSSVLRRLTEVSEARIDTMPAEAADLASAAICIADWLEQSEAVRHLHSAALRQHAYALVYTGDFGRALESVERAEELLASCVVSEYELARLNIVRAIVYRFQERDAEALELARHAARTFLTFADEQRFVSARMTEAFILMRIQRFHEALPVLTDIENNHALRVDTDTRARALNSLGWCQRHLGMLPEAVNSYQIAATLFDDIANVTEAARTRYAVALLLAQQGKHGEARERLRRAQHEFKTLGMAHNAVVAGLDLAEIALAESDFGGVEDLCREAIRQFEAAGVAYSREALTALTYLREAAEQQRATQETVWHVKTYIRRLPEEPALLFAPAPLPPV